MDEELEKQLARIGQTIAEILDAVKKFHASQFAQTKSMKHCGASWKGKSEKTIAPEPGQRQKLRQT